MTRYYKRGGDGFYHLVREADGAWYDRGEHDNKIGVVPTIESPPFRKQTKTMRVDISPNGSEYAIQASCGTHSICANGPIGELPLMIDTIIDAFIEREEATARELSASWTQGIYYYETLAEFVHTERKEKP